MSRDYYLPLHGKGRSSFIHACIHLFIHAFIHLLHHFKSNQKAIADRLGVDNFIAMSERDQLEANANSLDLILDLVPGPHDTAPYDRLLAKGGQLVIIGVRNSMLTGRDSQQLCFPPPLSLPHFLSLSFAFARPLTFLSRCLSFFCAHVAHVALGFTR